jgi:tetratricopeptide (TPR) repeat protein
MRIANAVVSYVSYIGKMIWPHSLAIFYLHPGLTLPPWQIAGASVLLLCITWLAMAARRHYPYVLMGWLWYLGTLVPVIGLVQVGLQAMADRYTYVPFLGLFIVLSWGLSDLGSSWRYRRTMLATGALMLLLALSLCTWRQLRHWRNSITLSEHTLQVTSRNFPMHNALANALADTGKLDEAIHHYTEALQIEPGYAEAHNNLGTVLIAKGNVDQAIIHYTEALRFRPGYTDAHYNLAGALTAKGKLDEAIEHYRQVLLGKPDHAGAHAELAMILKSRGRTEEAVGHYQQALRLKPDWPEVLNNLAWIFATEADPKLRNAANAQDLAEKACRLTGHKEAGLMDTLAAAYAEAARFHDAVQTAHKARDLALAAGRLELADVIEQRLQRYKAGKPYHEGSATHAPSAKTPGTGSACLHLP